jgi:hypothetical protein
LLSAGEIGAKRETKYGFHSSTVPRRQATNAKKKQRCTNFVFVYRGVCHDSFIFHVFINIKNKKLILKNTMGCAG